MPEIKQITVYKFEELSKEVQAELIEKAEQDVNANCDSLWGFQENCQELLEEWGFENADINYDLGYCQGSYFNFESKFYIETFIKHSPEWLGKYSFLLETDFEGHMTIGRESVFGDEDQAISQEEWDYAQAISYDKASYNDAVEKKILEKKKLAEDFIDIVHNKKDELEAMFKKDGYDWLEAETSEETLRERLIDDDCQYFENGEIYG